MTSIDPEQTPDGDEAPEITPQDTNTGDTSTGEGDGEWTGPADEVGGFTPDN